MLKNKKGGMRDKVDTTKKVFEASSLSIWRISISGIFSASLFYSKINCRVRTFYGIYNTPSPSPFVCQILHCLHTFDHGLTFKRYKI